jgi:integrase
MGSIRVRGETGRLYFDFRYGCARCREQTALPDTPGNRKKLEKILERIEAEITLGTFEYQRYFPNGSLAKESSTKSRLAVTDTPLFRSFAEQWVEEMRVQWRQSHYDTIQVTLKAYLVPTFGDQEVGRITKTDILAFRSSLAKVPGRGGRESLTASRINHIMTPLRMILNEAADRFEFTSPYRGIKSLKVPRTDVEPLSLEEVQRFLQAVRPDFRNYFTVRFFTGMRTAEIDGLKWQFVDFDNRLVLVRETLVNGRTEYTKNDGSQREIQMSTPVLEALRVQHEATSGMSEYVFCTRSGAPLSRHNVMNRVWYPTLELLGFKRRRPYQTRHTAATLWLAAGESPEWIAHQMGHTSTEMLFRVYSRYVPNLTRQDGSAIERLLASNLKKGEANAHDE